MLSLTVKTACMKHTKSAMQLVDQTFTQYRMPNTANMITSPTPDALPLHCLCTASPPAPAAIKVGPIALPASARPRPDC